MTLKIGVAPGYRFLKRFFPRSRAMTSGRRSHLSNYQSRITGVIGEARRDECIGKVVVDFGCGHGDGAIELAEQGFQSVVGIDIRPNLLESARQRAADAGVSDRCRFAERLPDESADVVVSIDSFEHFEDAPAVLDSIANLLVPGGLAIFSFGPTWYHPRGGHFFSPFPWAHLIFSESTLCRWRRDYRDDGATKFAEVDGGLNQMTIARFEQIVDAGPLEVESMVARPIGSLRRIHNRWTREFFTSVVDCVLVKTP